MQAETIFLRSMNNGFWCDVTDETGALQMNLQSKTLIALQSLIRTLGKSSSSINSDPVQIFVP